MATLPKQRNIAYRCPDCGSSIFGLVGKFALSANMIRLKCSCGATETLDINISDETKIQLSVPCLFCKQNHNYTVSGSLFFERELFNLSCPYSGMDIVFVGNEEKIAPELERTESEIKQIMLGLEAEELSDIQPSEMEENEILPDPSVYDTLRFLVKDLEAEGNVKCPCGKGEYDIRFAEDGIEAYCTRCGATYLFRANSPSIAEEYLNIDSLLLN